MTTTISTQVVVARTTHVGCASNVCFNKKPDENGGNSAGTKTYCEYGPGGNADEYGGGRPYDLIEGSTREKCGFDIPKKGNICDGIV